MKEVTEMNASNVIDGLMLESLKHNYVSFVNEWGYTKGESKLHGLFGDVWLVNRQAVLEWFGEEEQFA